MPIPKLSIALCIKFSDIFDNSHDNSVKLSRQDFTNRIKAFCIKYNVLDCLIGKDIDNLDALIVAQTVNSSEPLLSDEEIKSLFEILTLCGYKIEDGSSECELFQMLVLLVEHFPNAVNKIPNFVEIKSMINSIMEARINFASDIEKQKWPKISQKNGSKFNTLIEYETETSDTHQVVLAIKSTTQNKPARRWIVKTNMSLDMVYSHKSESCTDVFREITMGELYRIFVGDKGIQPEYRFYMIDDSYCIASSEVKDFKSSLEKMTCILIDVVNKMNYASEYTTDFLMTYARIIVTAMFFLETDFKPEGNFGVGKDEKSVTMPVFIDPGNAQFLQFALSKKCRMKIDDFVEGGGRTFDLNSEDFLRLPLLSRQHYSVRNFFGSFEASFFVGDNYREIKQALKKIRDNLLFKNEKIYQICKFLLYPLGLFDFFMLKNKNKTLKKFSQTDRQAYGQGEAIINEIIYDLSKSNFAFRQFHLLNAIQNDTHDEVGVKKFLKDILKWKMEKIRFKKKLEEDLFFLCNKENAQDRGNTRYQLDNFQQQNYLREVEENLQKVSGELDL